MCPRMSKLLVLSVGFNKDVNKLTLIVLADLAHEWNSILRVIFRQSINNMKNVTFLTHPHIFKLHSDFLLVSSYQNFSNGK